MAKSEYQKAITKINERMAQLYQTFGKENSTYQSMIAYIETIGGKDMTHKTTKGYKALSQSEKPKKGIRLNDEQINTLLGYKTSHAIRRDVINKMKKVGVTKPTDEEIKTIGNLYGKFDQFIQEHQGEIYKNEKTFSLLKSQGGDLDVDVMVEIMEEYGRPKELEEMHNVFKNESLIKW